MTADKALVTASVIKWARERAHLDLATAAKKIGRPQSEIEAWESGAEQPTLAQARKASDVYRRSLAVFYLPEPPSEFETLRDFRTLPDTENREYSPELALLIRRLQSRQRWIKEYLTLVGHESLSFIGSASEKAPIRRIVRAIRSVLGISPQEQIACTGSRTALNLWIERAEAIGIYVCREGKIASSEARGIALTDTHAPFVFVNTSDSYSGRLFTLVHELAHLWINKPGISNLENIKRRATAGDAAIEAFCNRVASLTLLDETLFNHQWLTRDDSRDLRDQIEAIASYFNVSKEVVARRLLDKRIITQADYRELRRYYSQIWREHKEAEKKRLKATKSAPSFYTQKLHSNGRRFTRTVLGACSANQINVRDACAVLNVKVGHLKKLAQKAGVSDRAFGGGGI